MAEININLAKQYKNLNQSFVENFEKKLQHALYMSSAIEELYQQLHYEFQLNKQLFNFSSPLICDQISNGSPSVYEIDKDILILEEKLEPKVESRNSIIILPTPCSTKKLTYSKCTATKTGKQSTISNQSENQQKKKEHPRCQKSRLIKSRLNEWLREEMKKQKPSIDNIRQQAMSYYKELKVKSFKASIVWVNKFFLQYGYDKKQFNPPKRKNYKK